MIGRSRAIADLGRIRLTGYPAWLFWCLVHLFLLTGFRNRLLVYINWSYAWFTYERGARLITGVRRREEIDLMNIDQVKASTDRPDTAPKL